MIKYDADYYERGRETGTSCYENYRWLPDLTRPMVAAVMAATGIKPTDTLLDFGCAHGYCVRAFRERGVNAWGVDISEYALAHAPKDTRPYLMHMSDNTEGTDCPQSFDWLFAKDVLEHLDVPTLVNHLDYLGTYCRNAFVVVPLGDDGKYFAEENEQDKTHVIRRPLEWWRKALGYSWKHVQSAYTMPGMKERFTEPKAHGFFICKTED